MWFRMVFQVKNDFLWLQRLSHHTQWYGFLFKISSGWKIMMAWNGMLDKQLKACCHYHKVTWLKTLEQKINYIKLCQSMKASMSLVICHLSSVTCHLFAATAGEIIFMEMGAEEEYNWRRQSHHSLIGSWLVFSIAAFHWLLSTDTFCSCLTTFHCYFPSDSLRSGKGHHGRRAEQQVRQLCVQLHSCKTWHCLAYQHIHCHRLFIWISLIPDSPKVRGFARNNPEKTVRRGGHILFGPRGADNSFLDLTDAFCLAWNTFYYSNYLCKFKAP